LSGIKTHECVRVIEGRVNGKIKFYQSVEGYCFSGLLREER